MSLLRDFGGALLTNVGADMQQRENDQRLTALQESIEKRRYAREMNRKARDEKQLPQPYGTPVQRGPGNWVQPTQEFQPSTYDEQTGDPLTESSWKPGADTPTADPYALTPKEQQKADLEERKFEQQVKYQDGRVAAMGRKGSGGSGGSTGAAPKSRWLPLSGNMEQLQEWDGAKFIPVGDPRPRWESASDSGGSKPSAKADTTYRAALEKERSRAATYVNKQLEPLNKLPEEQALQKIYETSGIRAPSLAAYRENQIQAAMAPWVQENPAPGNEAPAGGMPEPKSPQDLSKLKSGTVYKAPDGTIRTKK